MAKIKINKLPAGFTLTNGKIVEGKSMRNGGDLSTGDQANYGLVTTPQEYYGNTNFNNTDDKDVRYSLSSVAREDANIEAEGGETVLADLTNDGTFGLYDIKGPRHSKGGVPMFLPEQSFIFSDTNKMKFTKKELAEYGFKGNKKITPAKLSKKFQLNDYYAHLESDDADIIQANTAELMLAKNGMSLSKLAFAQEAKKKFEEGVPLASYPFLVEQGIDPIEFTAQMEKISEEEAQRKSIEALPPEQQEQIMMMQQMMAQVDQQDQQGQQQVQQQVPQQGMQIAQKGVEKTKDEFVNPGIPAAQWEKWLPRLKAGATLSYKENADGSTTVTISKESSNVQLTRSPQGKQATDIIYTDGSGNARTSIYGDDVEGQGKAMSENPNWSWSGGLDIGERALHQGQNSDGTATGREDLINPESVARFERDWGDVIDQVEEQTGDDWNWEIGFHNDQWGVFQDLAEVQREADAEEAGVPYYPYFKEKNDPNYEDGQGFDSKIGGYVMNMPRYIKNDGFQDEAIIAGDDDMGIGIPEDYPGPSRRFWQQDLNTLASIDRMQDKPFWPWSSDNERINLDPVFDDPQQRINSNTAQLAVEMQALNNAGGVHAVANSNAPGKTWEKNARDINTVNTNNLNIANQFEMFGAQMNRDVDEKNTLKHEADYDDTMTVLQNLQNFRNKKDYMRTNAYNNALTNAANTNNLNYLYDNFEIDPSSGGFMNFTNPNALQRTGIVNDQDQRSETWISSVAHLAEQLGRTPTEGEIKSYLEYIGLSSTGKNQNNFQQEVSRRGTPSGYPTSAKGTEITYPFNVGKMGN